MARPIEFWFEFASTYSYLSAMQIEARAQEAGVQLIWRPFLLGPVFAEQGLSGSPFQAYPVKGAYMWTDMARCAAAQGLAFKKPSAFPRGSLLATRIALAHADTDWIGQFVRRVYTANFAQDRDISDDAVIANLVSDIGQDPDAAIAAAQTVKTELRAATDEAMARGIFGAPTFMVGDALYWGNDRLDMALAAAQDGGIARV